MCTITKDMTDNYSNVIVILYIIFFLVVLSECTLCTHVLYTMFLSTDECKHICLDLCRYPHCYRLVHI